MNYISAYCHISSNKCHLNGKSLGSFNTDFAEDFIKKLYDYLEIKYSKFHKMDYLSKVAFIGSELIKKELPEINQYDDSDITLLFSNKNSSSLTDIQFQDSYKNGGIPSPSLFVYTLPNILVGEIAIRNKWHGENLFTVMQDFNAAYFTNYCSLLLNKNSNAVLCGWINVADNGIEAFLFFVTKSDLKQLNLQLEPTKLLELYKQIKF